MTSVEEDEMVLFEKLSRLWWEPNGPLKHLHALNEFLVPLIRTSLIESGICHQDHVNTSTPLKGLSIMDAGCGAGFMTEALAKLDCDITGLDPCENMIKVAKDHATLSEDLTNIKYILSDVETFAEQNEPKFDAIVSCGVLEHVTKYQQYLEGCIKCLKPGGSIFVITFHRSFLAWFAGVFLAEYVFNMAPRGTHDWRKFIALSDTKRVLKQYKCENKSDFQLMARVFTQEWYLSRLNGILYATHSVKK